MTKVIRGRAPFRVDLAGAWSDIPFYSDLYGGATINAAIDIYAKGNMYILDNGALYISYGTDIPSGSGLGTSGALNVLYYALVNHRTFSSLSKNEIALGAYKIERALGSECGKQDQCAAAYGGINKFVFGSKEKEDDISVIPLDIHGGCQGFNERILLINTNIIHSSSGIITEVKQKFEDGNVTIKNAIAKMVDTVCLLEKELCCPNNSQVNWEAVGEILTMQFVLMKQMSEKTTHEAIEWLLANIKPYIYGAKPGGAGGGGCIIALCRSSQHKKELQYLLTKEEYSQFSHYDVSIDKCGVTIWEE